MPDTIPTIGGIKASEWIGRRLYCKFNRIGSNTRNSQTVKLISISENGKKALVLPGGHRQTENVKLEMLIPWWGGNPDLKAKADAL